MKKTLVVGVSLKPHRYSNIAVHRLVSQGVETIAFGPRPGEVAGVSVVTEFPGAEDMDTISLYLNPERQRQFYERIIGLRPRRVIFNPGTENPEFYEELVVSQIFFEEACTLTLLAIGQY